MELPTSRGTARLILVMLSVALVTPVFSAGSNVASASTTQVPLCEGSNLWGAYVATGAATGNYIYTVALINVSATTCRLQGYP